MNPLSWVFEHAEIVRNTTIVIAFLVVAGIITMLILRLRCPACKKFGRKLAQKVLLDKKQDLEEWEEQIPIYGPSGEKTGYTTQTKQKKITFLNYMNTFRCPKCGNVWTEPSQKKVNGWV
jgi:uncharacterized C2H2 Zn-finger protein